MKDAINLVVLPLYRNEEDYSYLPFYSLRNDKNTLDLTKLENLLFNLNSKYTFNEIYIEGGEISKLSNIYFSLLFNLLKIYNKKIHVTTSFIDFNEALINGADVINIQYDFDNLSKNNKIIKNNIKAASNIGKVINIQTFDINVNKNELENIVNLNKLGIKSWKIIPFIKTEYNVFDQKLDYTYFESVILKYLKLTDYMRFSFINKLELENVIENNNFPIKTIYITPNNRYGLCKFNERNELFLEEFDNINDLEKNFEKIQNEHILLCKDCKNKMNCLANRYFNPYYKGKSCSGFKNLIKTVKDK